LIPGLILAIEEPELYQHPTKQRHFAKVLTQLSDGSLPGVATNLQVVFASHSPYFVSTDRFDEVRLARRHTAPDAPHKECKLRESSLDKVCKSLESAHAKPAGTFTAVGLRSRLHIVTPELAEGFFADLVVLVEGESDRAAVKAIANLMKVDLEALGIAVLPANSKNNIDRPGAIFKSLGIPVFAIWDCDKKGENIQDENTNRALQRLFGSIETEVVSAGARIEEGFACFEQNLEKTLEEEFGADAFLAAIDSCKLQFSIQKNEDVIKSPAAMRFTLAKLIEQGLRSPSLEGILEGIRALKMKSAPNTA
jgi:predicted ATP-dependent endonuclease of OLD family